MINIKSQREIELMRNANQIVAETLKLIEESIHPGITTAELDKLAERFIRSKGAIPSFKGYPGMNGDFPASICASVNEEVIHGIPGHRELKNGDIISVDVGTYINGFNGDAARTFKVGEVSTDADKLIEVTRQSFFEGIKLAKEGNRLYDISKAIQDYVEAYGYQAVRDYVGHGIGREMHEQPSIPNQIYEVKGRGVRLQKGMTLAIEPMINIGGYQVKTLKDGWTVVTSDGSLSAHYENTILITDGEPEVLTLY
jgi:methionyl aminopeptidase